MRDHYARSSAMGCAVALAMLSLMAGCGPSKPSADPGRETPARETPPDPQAVLDAATKRMNDEGTGSYIIEVSGIRVTTKGKFDLNGARFSQAMTTHLTGPELPNGFTVRSIMFKNEAFARVSDGPASKCWMRYESSDFADSVGGTAPLAPSEFAAMSTPPAAEILKNPKARGFAKNSTTEVRADVPVRAAFLAAATKAANLLSDQLDEKLTVPIRLTVEDGTYTGATYTVRDVLRAADLRRGDIKKAGLIGDMPPRQAYDLLATMRVEITYGTFGQKVDVSRPPKDRIADLDLATMSETDIITCKAAER